MTEIAPTMFDSLNARAISAESLAEGFIPPEHFRTVVRRAHTLVIGPRGSGKTCLMKMLQPAALNAWQSNEAKEYKAQVDFTGVYIPADISWSSQLKHLGAERLDVAFRKRLESAALSAHVLHAFVSAVTERTLVTCPGISRLHLKLPGKIERDIAVSLSRRWQFDEAGPSLLSVKHTLLARANDVWRFALQESLTSVAGREDRFVERRIFDFDFIQEVQFCIEVIDDIANRKNDRWALLFDELEIAPSWILERLISSFRSTAQKLLLKLTISPYTRIHAFNSPQAPQQGQDFDLIRLWYGYKQEGRPFCEKLFVSVLKAKGIRKTDPGKILGRSPLKGGEGTRGSAYAKGSPHQVMLKDAYKADASFREYCQRNRIDLDRLDKLSEKTRASLIRKIVPVLMFRQEFRKGDEAAKSGARLRSRKRPTIYSGADTFFEMLEGNPRWLIGIMQEMLPLIKRGGRVGANTQLKLIDRTAERFCSILNTIPLASTGLFSNNSVLDALSAVAEIIHNSVVRSDFTSEPFGSLTIDRYTPRILYDAIGNAINAGALVLQFNQDSEGLAVHLEGKRVRLAYLLSPRYRIPLRLSRPLPLSRALESLGSKKGARRAEERMKGGAFEVEVPSSQLELFQ